MVPVTVRLDLCGQYFAHAYRLHQSARTRGVGPRKSPLTQILALDHQLALGVA